MDRTLRYKEQIHKMKCKSSARNNIRRKLSNTKWGAKPLTIKTNSLALCYYGEIYACHVWERSKHVSKLDPALNVACRSITGCLRPTSVENVYFLNCWYCTTWCQNGYHISKREKKANRRSQAFHINNNNNK